MCYYAWDVKELVKISEWNNGIYSYSDEDCYQSIEDDKIKTHFAVSSRVQIDNKNWFNNVDAKQLCITSANQLTEKYPNKIILIVGGVQSCNGGYEPPDQVIGFYNGEEIFNTEVQGYSIEKKESYQLTEELLNIIKIRQKEVEEKDRIEKEKYDNYWNKRKVLIEPTQEAYEKIKNGTNMRSYSYDENGMFNMAQSRDEENHINKAYRAGIKTGFKKAFEYIQEDKKLLELLNENFITKEEKIY